MTKDVALSVLDLKKDTPYLMTTVVIGSVENFANNTWLCYSVFCMQFSI